MIFVREKQFYRDFFMLGSVIAAQNIIVFAVNLADNVMIGGYSEIALSAVAVVNQIQFLLQMLALGTVNGLVVLASQYWGSRNTKPIKLVMSSALIFGMLLTFLLFFSVLFFPEGCFKLLTDQVAVVNEAKLYLKIICFSYPLFTLTQLFLGLMRSVEKVRIGFVVSVVALFVNVILNYGLIYGRLGMPELGIRGAAIATLISRIAEFAVASAYVFFVDKRIDLRLKDLFRFRKEYISDYFRVGFPLILSSASWGVAMTVQGSILGHLGSESVLGANSIASAVFSVVSVAAYAAGNASGVIIGKTIGENRLADVKAYTRTFQALFLIIGVVSGVILFLCKGLVIGFYAVSAQTAALADSMMTVLSVTLVGTAYEAPCLTGIVSAGGDTSFVLKNDLIFMWCIVIPLSLLSAFVLKLPPIVTFICLKSDQVTKCAVAAVKVNRFKWIRKLTRDS